MLIEVPVSMPMTDAAERCLHGRMMQLLRISLAALPLRIRLHRKSMSADRTCVVLHTTSMLSSTGQYLDCQTSIA